MSFGGSLWCRSTPDTKHRSIYTNTNRSTGTPEHRSTTPTESTASCNAVRILTHEEFAAKHPHPPSSDKVRIDRHANINIDRHSEANIDRQPSPPIDRRASITYRVQMPKIDVAQLNALRPKPKPSEQPLDSIDRHVEANIDRQPSSPIDRRAPITYRVQMPKIDVARLNALRTKPKPPEHPPEPVRTPSEDGEDPMEEDRVSTGRTLRKKRKKWRNI
ncbi:hypothetical protein DY000_02055546 [Brassica cretica]|uniref:Uncharacterized protein n=1 Tax=Brassica cretica TaxID=69181 RepID=A0ABQ7A7X6_BRACR|nr:hypothetical protein DY000_02055546 [Brassica cretica]